MEPIPLERDSYKSSLSSYMESTGIFQEYIAGARVDQATPPGHVGENNVSKLITEGILPSLVVSTDESNSEHCTRADMSLRLLGELVRAQDTDETLDPQSVQPRAAFSETLTPDQCREIGDELDSLILILLEEESVVE